MIAFDAAHAAVHHPSDRRFTIWIKPAVLTTAATLLLVAIAAAWIQIRVWGVPVIAPVPQVNPNNLPSPHGFPLWVRYGHFFNFLFVMLLMRSGLSILMDHPRMYFNDHCTPGSEWIRFTPMTVPRDRLWTAKDDARYISPLVATPGYRHTVGIARAWHFINVHGFIITGVLFAVLLVATDQWRRIVPMSPVVLGQAWNTWVHYATLHMPSEPNGFYGYNALQQIAYFSVFFIFGPVAILTGIAMSPAIVNRFPFYARLFGGRQAARSIHFLTMVGFLAFLAVHITLVVMTGFARNMNHIVMGTDDTNTAGMVWGFVGVGAVVASWIAAHYVSWTHPRALQRTVNRVTYPMQRMTLNLLNPHQRYREGEVSPFFWPNGKLPARADWRALAAEGFQNYRLVVGGLVEHPIAISLAELRHLGTIEQITMHHCIQGWTGIAKWTGVPMSALIRVVRPLPAAQVVAFFSYGESLYGGTYYDTQRIDNVLKPECLLAFEMNGQPLPIVYGAPLRLRVENQLGYKMVKWIERIEFVESERQIGQGQGGKNEDDEYFDLLPNI
ncbi:MAG TPA: molybdopterin-dependent oxidoreductase [Vicinamibacterales bacterium]|nr:molybdopterin-dependent oxidoreductase [Vicinamibacterales bacterium]